MLLNAISKSMRRPMSTVVCSTFLKYSEMGDPLQVLHKCTEPLGPLKNTEVLIKTLVAPINPADINMIQGKYGERPNLPCIPGNEILAEVLAVGADVQSLAIGDHVIHGKANQGTWRSHSVHPADALIPIPKEMDIVAAATITVNPCTAYRMLKDFGKLQQGDTIIQNGANSAVGQAVIQLCRIWGLNSVNIVRNRPDLDQLTAYLKKLGASEVLTEEQVRTTTIFKDGCLPRPKLAFNCIGGKSATEIIRHLADKGQLVTYGAMSRESVTAPNAALIFKDIAFRGYWMSRWTQENARNNNRKKMLDELIGLYMDGQMQGPVHELVPFDEYQRAITSSIDFKGFTGKKFILSFG